MWERRTSDPRARRRRRRGAAGTAANPTTTVRAAAATRCGITPTPGRPSGRRWPRPPGRRTRRRREGVDIGRRSPRSTVIPCTFIATSSRPFASPTSTNTRQAPGTTATAPPAQGRALAERPTITTRRLPKRVTRARRRAGSRAVPASRRAAPPERPCPEPARSWMAGRREKIDANSTPLRAKTTVIATRARHTWAPGSGSTGPAQRARRFRNGTTVFRKRFGRGAAESGSRWLALRSSTTRAPRIREPGQGARAPRHRAVGQGRAVGVQRDVDLLGVQEPQAEGRAAGVWRSALAASMSSRSRRG